MKIVNGKELAFMPNGTVFSEITDVELAPTAKFGIDARINGLHVLCRHGDYFPPSSSKFNGVVHILDCVRFFNTETSTTIVDYTDLCGINFNDEKNHFAVYDKEDIEGIIKNLQWVLNGCEDK